MIRSQPETQRPWLSQRLRPSPTQQEPESLPLYLAAPKTDFQTGLEYGSDGTLVPQNSEIQTYTSSNTDQYKHRRPMHTLSFSILAFLYASTGIGTVKSGAPARTAASVCQRYLSFPSRTRQHASWSSAYSSSVL